MKFQLQNLKLNIIFSFILLFSVVLPVFISASLLYANYTRETQRLEEAQQRIEQQVSLNLYLMLSAVKAESNSLSQNPDIIELLNTKQEFRRFVENRVFGRLQEINLKFLFPIEWQLIKDDSSEPLLFSNSQKIPHTDHHNEEGFFLSTKKDKVILIKDINLDDQNLSGPNSNRKGSLILYFSILEIAKVIPELTSIVHLDKEASLQNLIINIQKPDLPRFVILSAILILGFILLFSIFSGLFLMRTYVLKPINKISTQLGIIKQTTNDNPENKNELYLLEKAIISYTEQLKNIEKEKAEKIKIEAISSLTRQVAHDIRSPLSALNLVSGTLTEVGEEKRLLIRNATQRINDIANQLLEKGKEKVTATEANNDLFQKEPFSYSSLQIELLSPLVDSIVSEKRIQFREKQNIEIEVDLTKGYGLFARIDSIELKRALSNLLNNAIEALPQSKGQIQIAIRKYQDLIGIIIQDNGVGIPESFIKKLGTKGFSYGKAQSHSGSGLGLFHAKNTVENLGGRLEVLSKEAQGTSITLYLPKAPIPSWFVEKIILKPHMNVVSLDDDLAIHQLWKERFHTHSRLSMKAPEPINHLTFTSGEEFKVWIQNHRPLSMAELSSALFLIDYELLGQPQTGLDLIEDLQIHNNSLLVTSRYEDLQIRERCAQLSLQIIPKTMAGFVPIEYFSENKSS